MRTDLKLGAATSREERSLLIGSLYRGGETMEDIGARFGLSRERVRQILTRSGQHLGPCSRVDLTLIGRVRDRVERGEAETLRAACRPEAVSFETIYRTLYLFGMVEALSAGVARNRCHRAITLLLDHYRELGERLGRAPTAGELAPKVSDYQYWFGSLNEVARLTGWPSRIRSQQLDPDHMRTLHQHTQRHRRCYPRKQ